MGILSSIFDPYMDKAYGNVASTPDRDDNDYKGSVPNLSEDSTLEYTKVNSLHGIFGIPYQFMDSVDMRYGTSSVGRKYSEKILSKSPMLFLTPVKQKFMKDFTEDDQGLVQSILSGASSELAQGLEGSGKYYSTEFAYDEYYYTVNKMCSELAYFLGIGNVEIGQIGSNSTVHIRNIDWAKSQNNAFKHYRAANKSVVMYLDGNSVATVSDNFSNQTTESSLASTLNGYSEQSRELQFLLSDSVFSELMNDAGGAKSEITENLASLTQNLTGGMLSDLAGTGVNTVLAGGKIIFPKIWGDSQYSRSYSFDIKLRSPDHDKVSIFLNVLVPYIHLLGMVLPRSLDSQNPNAFQSPLLVKAYCSGMFGIDMGLITDMTVNRGAECQWNDDGLPTQIDISLQIEDLYQSLMLTQYGNKPGNIFNNVLTDNWDLVTNTGMLEFLANMAGLNVADMEIGTRQRLYCYLQASDLARLPSTVGTIVDNKVQNWWYDMTRWLYTG